MRLERQDAVVHRFKRLETLALDLFQKALAGVVMVFAGTVQLEMLHRLFRRFKSKANTLILQSTVLA